ncbi:endonuclease domain-containing protein [Pseudoxanthomonas dokdonensis]|uniref:endonuclease domain-containing protein n=1 Tax=Pseudoxanthomonas dokdonensis TaxID=344882 RepID=UPI0009F9E078|nr:DUF559 domain-containing protein [Pseudoxanthomonas dokdonensis]
MRQGQKRDRARQLRRDMTTAERRLWGVLQKRQLDGCRFRRQHPIGRYIADFACLEVGLIVEVDGGQHMDARSDRVRDAFLQEQGFQVLRFWNDEVLTNLDGVYCRLEAWLNEYRERCPHPNPRIRYGAGSTP